MLPKARGGAWARQALLLAPLLIGGLAAGCGTSSSPAAQRFVRLDALLPLHPAWAQVRAVDEVNTRLTAASAVSVRVRAAAPPLPPPFPFAEVFPESVSEERQRRLRSDANRYLAQFAETERAHKDQQFQQEARAARKRFEAQYATKLAERETELRTANAKKARELYLTIRRLKFNDVALSSQIRVWTDQPRLDSIARQKEVRAEIARLTSERERYLADVHPQAVQDLEPLRKRMEQDLESHLQQREDDLNALVEAQIERERDRLKTESAAIPPLSRGAAPPFIPHEIPFPSEHLAYQAAQGQITTALSQQRAASETQKAALIAAIREDTQKAVEQVARQQGWRLVPTGTLLADDATEEVARALRAQWRIGAGP